MKMLTLLLKGFGALVLLSVLVPVLLLPVALVIWMVVGAVGIAAVTVLTLLPLLVLCLTVAGLFWLVK